MQITEIMYDAPGGDSGKEWIEITNTGVQAVDVSAYKLGEANTNHKLVIASGNSILAPGTSAIIASDPAAFKSNWPTYAGTIFRSAFSLSNTGETLAIKNASSSVEDTVSYTSSMGAAGDSGSLHRDQNNFIAALPNPGVYPGEIKAVPKAAPKVTKAPITKTSSKSSPTQTAAADAPQATFGPSLQSKITPSPMIYWLLGLIALIAVGIAGVICARLFSSQNTLHLGETKPQEEEFSLIEN